MLSAAAGCDNLDRPRSAVTGAGPRSGRFVTAPAADEFAAGDQDRRVQDALCLDQRCRAGQAVQLVALGCGLRRTGQPWSSPVGSAAPKQPAHKTVGVGIWLVVVTTCALPSRNGDGALCPRSRRRIPRCRLVNNRVFGCDALTFAGGVRLDFAMAGQMF